MSRKWIYDYYTVTVPADVDSVPEDLMSLAIRQAEENTRVYSLPSYWTATAIEVGDHTVTYRVVRKRPRRSS